MFYFNALYPTKIGTYDASEALLGSVRATGVVVTARAEEAITGLILSELKQTVNLVVHTLQDLEFSKCLNTGQILRGINKVGKFGFCSLEAAPQFVLQYAEELKKIAPEDGYLYFATSPAVSNGRLLMLVLYCKGRTLILDATQVGPH